MSLLDLMFRGGVLMWPLLLCAILTVFVALERYTVLHKARLDASQFMMKLKSLYRRGDVAAVLAFCSQKDVPIANIVRRGALKHGQGEQKLREAVENAGKEEVYRLELRLPLLSGIAGVAPMLGFLGTVTGVMSAIRTANQGDAPARSVMLAGGISESMLSTAFGLAIGILALTLHKYFVSNVEKAVHEMQVTSTEFLDLLEGGPVTEFYVRKEQPKEPPRAIVYDEDEFFRRKS
jgi:biopolymer transport protein ExbB